MTTDGTITDIAREEYVDAEADVIEELEKIGKPFIILVNSRDPKNKQCMKLVESLQERYHVPVRGLMTVSYTHLYRRIKPQEVKRLRHLAQQSAQKPY